MKTEKELQNHIKDTLVALYLEINLPFYNVQSGILNLLDDLPGEDGPEYQELEPLFHSITDLFELWESTVIKVTGDTTFFLPGPKFEKN